MDCRGQIAPLLGLGNSPLQQPVPALPVTPPLQVGREIHHQFSHIRPGFRQVEPKGNRLDNALPLAVQGCYLIIVSGSKITPVAGVYQDPPAKNVRIIGRRR